MPWLVAGDFNEILFEAEKKGGHGGDLVSISEFRGVVDFLELKDLGCSGHPFTWSKRRSEGFVEERLDKALANDEWIDLFPSFRVRNMVWDSSDHKPIVVKACKYISYVDRAVPWDSKPFKFEAKWLHVEGFKDVVSQAWEDSSRSCFGDWSSKVEKCVRMLHKWGSQTFKAIHKRLRWLLKRLKRLRAMIQSLAITEEERRVET